MDLEKVKKYLERAGDENDDVEFSKTAFLLPPRFFELFVSHNIHVDLIEPTRVVCSFKVPSRLLNSENYLHGGAIGIFVDLVGSAAIYTMGTRHSGISMEISVTYLDAAYIDEEIEMEGKVLSISSAIAVVSVELKKKKTGKIIARGRHSKYLPIASKI